MTIIEICPDTTALRRSANQRRDKGVAILPKAISCPPCPNFRCTVLHYGDFQGYRTGSERNILNPRSALAGEHAHRPYRHGRNALQMKSCLVVSHVLHFPLPFFTRHHQIAIKMVKVNTVLCEAKVPSLRLSRCRFLPPCSPKSAVYAKKQPKSTRHLSRTLTTVCNTDVNSGPMLGCRSRAS